MKRNAMSHYVGTLREAKRAAYIAGAEAVLDLMMKRADRLVKGLPKSEDGRLAGTAVQSMCTGMYQDALRSIIAQTPFEEKVEDRPFSTPAAYTPPSE